MRRFIIVGIGMIALVAGLVGYRCYRQAEQPSLTLESKAGQRDTTTEWTPSEAELAKDNKGVGWVFGRVMGVADAPGSLNHSPFVGAPPVRAFPSR